MMNDILTVLALLIFHWYSSLFFQTIFLHRYASHNMYTLSPFMERVFYFFTFVFQGSSYLDPRAYGVLHKLHHKHSDTKDDPHSPEQYGSVWKMMLNTYHVFIDIQNNPKKYEHIKTGVRPWPTLDRIADFWLTRVGFMVLWFFIYYSLIDSSYLYLALGIHYLMGPIHGAIVNWCGHRYGYQNFDNGDKSTNALLIDFLMMGELYQNNHHKQGSNPKFSTKFPEIDPGYWCLYLLDKIGVLKLVKS